MVPSQLYYTRAGHFLITHSTGGMRLRPGSSSILSVVATPESTSPSSIIYELFFVYIYKKESEDVDPEGGRHEYSSLSLHKTRH